MQMISRRGSVSLQRRLSVISGGVWKLLGCVGADTHVDDLQKEAALLHQMMSKQNYCMKIIYLTESHPAPA